MTRLTFLAAILAIALLTLPLAPLRADTHTVPNADLSTVDGNVSSGSASGTFGLTVTVTVRNLTNGPLASQTVTLASSRGGDDAITPASVTTGADGRAIFTVTTIHAGAPSYTATVTSASPPVAITDKHAMTWNSLVDGNNSTAALTVASAPADQTTQVVARVTARGSGGGTLAGRRVAITSSRGDVDMVSLDAATTNASGEATARMVSCTIGTPTLTFVVDGVTLTAQPTPILTADTFPATARSTLQAVAPAEAPANNSTTVTVIATLKSICDAPISNAAATLSSSRGTPPDAVQIPAGMERTDASGIISFFVRSQTAGTSIYTAKSGGVTLTQTATIVFTPLPITPSSTPTSTPPASPPPAPTPTPTPTPSQTPSPPPAPVSPPPTTGALAAGNLFKSTDLAAVYYYGRDGKRYAFPDEKIYKSWYADFSGVKTVLRAEVLTVPLGGSVRPRPGAKLVQFVSLAADERSFVVSDPKVYALERGGTLRWIKTAEVARTLYGALWEQEIVPVLETFFGLYRSGYDINAASNYSPGSAGLAATSIDRDLGL